MRSSRQTKSKRLAADLAQLDDSSLAYWREHPAEFIEQCVVNPETGKPFVLLDAEKQFLQHAFTTDDNGRLLFPDADLQRHQEERQNPLGCHPRHHRAAAVWRSLCRSLLHRQRSRTKQGQGVRSDQAHRAGLSVACLRGRHHRQQDHLRRNRLTITAIPSRLRWCGRCQSDHQRVRRAVGLHQREGLAALGRVRAVTSAQNLLPSGGEPCWLRRRKRTA